MIEGIFGSTTPILEKSLALRMARQGVLASNIANAETPNFRTVDINFEQTMQNLVRKNEQVDMTLQRTDPRHFAEAKVDLVDTGADSERIVFVDSGTKAVGNDSNSVDLDVELAKSQENSLLYSVTTQLLARKLKTIANIIDSTSRI